MGSATKVRPDVHAFSSTSVNGGERVPPSVKQAKEHQRQQLPHQPDGQPLAWRHMTAEQLGLHFGSGIGLYFATLKGLALLCLVMFIAYIPLLLVSNASANYVDIYRPALDSEGSHGLIRAITRGTKAISLTIGGLAVNDAPGVPVFEGKYFNVYGSLGRRKGILISSVVWLYLYTVRTVKRIDMDSVEVADYTLFIRGLPEDASKDEVRDYFQSQGFAVREVALVHKIMEVWDNTTGRVRKLRDIEELEAQMELKTNLTVAKRDALSEQLLKLKGELNELEAKIEEDQAKGLDAKETMAAFVTFETEEALAAANALLPHRKLVDMKQR